MYRESKTIIFMHFMYARNKAAQLHTARPLAATSASLQRPLFDYSGHTTRWTPARHLHTQRGSRATAQELDGRLTCAAALCAPFGRVPATCSPLDGRFAPTRTTAPTRLRTAFGTAGASLSAATAAAAAELLGTAAAILDAEERIPVRVERGHSIAARAAAA